MVVAAILGVALGYSGRRWWLSGTGTVSRVIIYGMSGSSEGFMLVGMMVVLFFPLFFSIGGLASMIGRFFRQWNGARSGVEPRNP